MLKRSAQIAFAAATILAAAVPALAGGFYAVLGNPEANAQAKAAGAVVTIKLAGCHEPEKADLSAVAITNAGGQRNTIPLKLIKLAEPGFYAVRQQWPSEGRWVLQFIARDGDRTASTLAAASGAAVERDKAVLAMRLPSAADVSALLSTKADLARR